MNPEVILNSLFDAAWRSAFVDAHANLVLPKRPAGRVVVFGAGKAAAAMARELERRAPYRMEGMVVTRYGYAVPCKRIQVVAAAHPIPDAAGARAAGRMLDLAHRLTTDDIAICLWSGGGSSLLALPIPPISLSELQAITRTLLLCGASIAEINCVRRHTSRISGGRLAIACAPARVVNYVISDVAGDDLRDIACGPTSPDETTCREARDVISRYGIGPPDSVLNVLGSGRGETPSPGSAELPQIESSIVATSRDALAAAARCAEDVGITPLVLGDHIEGDATEVGKVLAGIALSVHTYGAPLKAPCIILSGGETTVTVRGNGQGGRNVQCLLSAAITLRGTDGIYALFADTDGIDGVGSAAGAVIFPDTLARAEKLGMVAKQFLSNNDAHSFFKSLGDDVVTGPTMTNVNDFRAILVAQ